MRVFICWLINVCDWVGELSIVYMVIAVSENTQTNNTFLNDLIPTDIHFAIAGALMAIIPAFVTAVYATLNYDLLLSWAVIRWMSPLNIVTNQFFYFFKTLFLSGAAWAAILTILTFKLFPNANLEWIGPIVRNVVNSIYHFFIV